MITLQLARDRPHGAGGLPALPVDEPFASLRGCLRQLSDDLVPPNEVVSRVVEPGEEVVLYVCRGSIELDAHLGRTVTLLAGDFARLSVPARTDVTVSNPSQRMNAHVYQVLFSADSGQPVRSFDRRRFTVAERSGLGCVVAAANLRGEAMRLHHDARVYSGVLQRGEHVVHELHPGRVAWVQLIQGSISVSGTEIMPGDRVCVSSQRTASLTSRNFSEVLVIDVIAPERGNGHGQ